MAVSSFSHLPLRLTTSNDQDPFRRVQPSSQCVVLEKHKGFGHVKMLSLITRCSQRSKGSVLVRNSVLPDGTPIPSGSSGSWKGWIFGLLITLIFPMWRTKLGPFALLKNKLDNMVQTAEDIAEVVEQVAEKVDDLAEEVSEHLPEGGKLRHAVDIIEDLAEVTAKQAHLLGEVIDKVQEMEDNLEELIEHPPMPLATGVDADKATATVTATVVTTPIVAVELKEDSSHGDGNESLSS